MTPYQFDPETRMAWLLVDRQAEALHEKASWAWLYALYAALLRRLSLVARAREPMPEVPVDQMQPPFVPVAADTSRVIVLDSRRPVEHRHPGRATNL